MKSKSADKIKMPSIDELLGVSGEESATDIEISRIHSFANHPFKVLDDDKMDDLVESIKQNGVLTPVLVRPDKNNSYEMISGHRRMHAAIKAGLETIPAIVRDMEDDEAIVIMVDANIQREELLPSEKAFAYKLKLEAMKHQGKRIDLEKNETSTPVVSKSRSNEELGSEHGESREQVRRYIRLTELIPELLDLVDEGRIAFRPAVELSYLQKEEQGALLEQISYADATPSLAQAIKLKRFSQDGKLNNEVIESIMSEEKPNQREKINIKYAEARRFIPASVPYEKTGDYIMKALEYYHRYQERQKSRNDAR